MAVIGLFFTGASGRLARTSVRQQMLGLISDDPEDWRRGSAKRHLIGLANGDPALRPPLANSKSFLKVFTHFVYCFNKYYIHLATLQAPRTFSSLTSSVFNSTTPTTVYPGQVGEMSEVSRMSSE